MAAYALIIETCLRKASIRIVHVSWFAIYALIFLFPFEPEMWQWGAFLFGWSGCLLPLLLSEGIFGDDIASGRIRLLATKPIRPMQFYLYRFLGLSLQGAIHISAAAALIFALHGLTGRGSVDRLGLWAVATWLVFNAWTALSTSLSVVVKRAHNSMLLFAATGMVLFMLSFLTSFFPNGVATVLFLRVLRYTCPSVELLSEIGLGRCRLAGGLGNAGYSLMLTAVYCAIGVVLLSKREFKGATD